MIHSTLAPDSTVGLSCDLVLVHHGGTLTRSEPEPVVPLVHTITTSHITAVTHNLSHKCREIVELVAA